MEQAMTKHPVRNFLLSVILPLALASVLQAQEAGAGLTPHDVARIRTVTAPVVSPDGNRVAYLLNVPRDPLSEVDGTAWRRLQEFDVASGNSREYVGGDLRIGSPGWTPD
jgi:hypothetical protein